MAARGGMGDVYLAATTGIEGAERPCIVKTVRRDHLHDSSFLARFFDEARVQAQLQHPSVAQVLEAATDDEGQPYTVVEYVEGRSLCDVRQRAIQSGVKIAWADAVAIAIEVAQGLAHVHERSGADGSPLGIVHRDLSPQNVMIGHSGEVKLIDFGTARGHNRRCHTVAGVVFAKPGYVAPEVARQQVGDGRIDLYALGIVLWELCAGRRFLTMDPQQHLDHAAAGKLVVPAVAAASGAPAALDDVIALLTKNDPDERYPRASFAVSDLGRLLAQAPAREAGERGVRARTAMLMHALWPHEPVRSRAEFVRLLRESRALLPEEGRSPGVAPVLVQDPVASSPAAASKDAAHLAGTPYRLLRVIGEGASGVVWEAEHIELERRVAVKVLSWEHAASQASVERFRCEARALAALSHPNLVQILDFGRSIDGRAFLAMELLVGETLEARLRRAPMELVEAARIAIQACGALGAVHAAGLVHRDIKPQNLMLSRGGRVKLLDFGVAMATANPADVDEAGAKGRARERALQGFAIFGTPEYMAPEQVAGEVIDQRADVYALGCVLYEMLVGSPPFQGSSVVVMGQQLRDTPKPLQSRGRRQTQPRGQHALRGALGSVVMRAMAKEPRERFATAAAMGTALRETLSVAARRRTRTPRLVQWTLLSTATCIAAAILMRWVAARPSESAIAPIASIAAATSTSPPASSSSPAMPISSAASAAPMFTVHTATPTLVHASTPLQRGTREIARR
jgi:serine/threonine protein kinase